MLDLSCNLESIQIDAKFYDKICVFHNDSGNGKTLLMSVIDSYCNDELDIPCFIVDYRFHNRSAKDIMFAIGNAKVVCLDNADLYMTYDLYDSLLESNKLIIISSHTLQGIRIGKTMKFYKVSISNNRLEVKRLGSE